MHSWAQQIHSHMINWHHPVQFQVFHSPVSWAITACIIWFPPSLEKLGKNPAAFQSFTNSSDPIQQRNAETTKASSISAHVLTAVRPNLCSPSSISAIRATRYLFEPCSAEPPSTMIGEKGQVIALSTYICEHAVRAIINSCARNTEVFPAGQMSFTEVSNNLLHYVLQSFYPTSVCFQPA